MVSDVVAPGKSRVTMEEKGHTISDYNLDELEAWGMDVRREGTCQHVHVTWAKKLGRSSTPPGFQVGKQRSLEKMQWRNEKREEKRYILQTFLDLGRVGWLRTVPP